MELALHQIELGRQFAAALNDCDYSRAAKFLADDCRYERPGDKSLVGPQAICDSYKECDVRARRCFESVTYHSEAASDPSGGVRLTFIDVLSSGNATHTFRCSQIVYFDENQKIERIELVKFPVERDRLNAFCASHGIRLH